MEMEEVERNRAKYCTGANSYGIRFQKLRIQIKIIVSKSKRLKFFTFTYEKLSPAQNNTHIEYRRF